MQDFTGVNAQALGDFEVSSLKLLGESLPKKSDKREEVKADEITSRKTGEQKEPAEKPKDKPSGVKEDSSDNVKKIAFIVIVLLALVAVRLFLFK